jgi:YbbR domain-containing protein
MENGTEKSTAKTGNFLSGIRRLIAAGANSGTKGEKKPWFKLPLTMRIFFLVLSVLLAMFLGGCALMAKNPDRKKTFANITPTIEASAMETLNTTRFIALYGDINELLKPVSVTVSAPITDVSKIKASDITASVDLKKVTHTGAYDLEVKATCAVGTVVSVEPSTIRLEFDTLKRNDSIPVTCVFTGELPEGYWHGEPKLNTDKVDLSGAQRTIDSIKRAVCYIDLDGLTSGINDALQLTIIDKEDNEMSNASFREVIPSVTVEMEVLPHKVVPIEYEISDADLLPNYLQLEEPRLSVTEVDIAAPAGVLDTIDKLVSEPLHISTITEPQQYTETLTFALLPEGAKPIDGTNLQGVLLALNITEKIEKQVFDHFAIRFEGESPDLIYEYAFTDVDITITGPSRLVKEFLTTDLTVVVNVGDRGPNVYDLSIETSVDKDRFGEIEIILAKSVVRVTIRQRSTQ